MTKKIEICKKCGGKGYVSTPEELDGHGKTLTESVDVECNRCLGSGRMLIGSKREEATVNDMTTVVKTKTVKPYVSSFDSSSEQTDASVCSSVDNVTEMVMLSAGQQVARFVKCMFTDEAIGIICKWIGVRMLSDIKDSNRDKATRVLSDPGFFERIKAASSGSPLKESLMSEHGVRNDTHTTRTPITVEFRRRSTVEEIDPSRELYEIFRNDLYGIIVHDSQTLSTGLLWTVSEQFLDITTNSAAAYVTTTRKKVKK